MYEAAKCANSLAANVLPKWPHTLVCGQPPPGRRRGGLRTLSSEAPRRPGKGRERAEKRNDTLGSPLPTPGSPLEGVVERERQRVLRGAVPNALGASHHTRESSKVQHRFAPLPVIERGTPREGVYYGPGLRDSSWSLWNRADARNAQRVLYRTFYNTKWGIAVELDMTSFGSLRYSISDFAKPVLVTRAGLQHNIEAFGAPKLLHELRTRQRVGAVRMAGPTENFGEWVAKVVGMTVLLSQANYHNPVGGLQLLLFPDGFVFVGETMSINAFPQAFLAEGGKMPVSFSVEDARERIQKEMAAHKAPGFQQTATRRAESEVTFFDEDADQAERVRLAKAGETQSVWTGDWVGGLRRALRARTDMQKAENAACQSFLKLPADVRLEAAIFVETEKVERERRTGIISEEQYQSRIAAVKDRATFPARALRATEAHNLSMFCDKDSGEHRSALEFDGWDKLSWEAKLDVAKTVQHQRQHLGRRTPDDAELHGLLQKNASGLRKGGSFAAVRRREAEGERPETDLQMQRQVHLDPQRVELVAGQAAQGFTRFHTHDLEIQKKRFSHARGKEVRQLYEECDKCGRPCQVAGKGICNRCLDQEKELRDSGMDRLMIEPDTFYGDSRALLGHKGFSDYIGPPLKSDLKISKAERGGWLIEPRLYTADASSRRGHLDQFGQTVPRPMRSEEEKTRERQRVQEEHEEARRITRRALDLDRGENVTQEEKSDFVSLVRNGRFDAVKLMLMRDIASFSEDPLSEQRDRHGNTAVIIAAQQGLLKITKLLVAASCNLNAQNKKGDTALHYAGLYGFHSLMDYLKRKGADDSIHNHAGKTCYQIEATLPS